MDIMEQINELNDLHIKYHEEKVKHLKDMLEYYNKHKNVEGVLELINISIGFSEKNIEMFREFLITK